MPKFDAKKVAEVHQHLHSHLPSDPALRIKALETLLVRKGLIESENIDAWVEAYSEHIGPKRGAHVVAKAWCDADFKQRLLA
ncbi:MAG: nitrile hydratase, partial [Gammaproteobacteria bacterium]